MNTAPYMSRKPECRRLVLVPTMTHHYDEPRGCREEHLEESRPGIGNQGQYIFLAPLLDPPSRVPRDIVHQHNRSASNHSQVGAWHEALGLNEPAQRLSPRTPRIQRRGERAGGAEAGASSTAYAAGRADAMVPATKRRCHDVASPARAASSPGQDARARRCKDRWYRRPARSSPATFETNVSAPGRPALLTSDATKTCHRARARRQHPLAPVADVAFPSHSARSPRRSPGAAERRGKRRRSPAKPASSARVASPMPKRCSMITAAPCVATSPPEAASDHRMRQQVEGGRRWSSASRKQRSMA